MLNRARAVIATAAFSLASTVNPALAQDVELRSFDGTVELEGNLIAYDGAYYQIDTIYGPLTISAEGVSCAGPRLPRPDELSSQKRISPGLPRSPRVSCQNFWLPLPCNRTWT
jgi:phosphate transport system substrate-binding protein